jgi:propanol-preferring alcohol dehydrogenase
VRLGIYGFGAAARIVVQIARHKGRQVYAFTQPDDWKAQKFACSLGAVWAGDFRGGSPGGIGRCHYLCAGGRTRPGSIEGHAEGRSRCMGKYT